MQSILILTKRLAPTDTKGARVRASVVNGAARLVRPWEYSESTVANHYGAAVALAMRALGIAALSDDGVSAVTGETADGVFLAVTKH